MPRFEPQASHFGLVGATPEQIEGHFMTESFRFIVGADAKVFYLNRGLVSQLSKPLDTLINGGMRESREGFVIWEDVEVDVFVRFIQFTYTGSYPRFEPKMLPPSPTDEAASLTAKVVENFIDHISPKAVKEPVVIDMTDDTTTNTTTASTAATTAASTAATTTASTAATTTAATTATTAATSTTTPATTLALASSTLNQPAPPRTADSSRRHLDILTDFNFDLFLVETPLTPSPLPPHNEKKDAFKLPYSLASYKRAAADWLGGRNHSSSCRRGPASFSGPAPAATSRYAARQAAKRKFEAISCDCDVGNEGTPSERKRDFISAFMAKQSPALGYDRTALNEVMLADGIGKNNALGPAVRWSFEPVFVGHARLWVFADRYAITALMDLACGHLVHELSNWVMSRESFVSEFGDLARYVYDNTVSGCQLRLLVAQFAACLVEDVAVMEDWVAMLNDVPDFAGDLINQLVNRLA